MQAEEVIRNSFSSMPRNGDELARLLAFGACLDEARGFPCTSMGVNDVVFGDPKDTMYKLTPRCLGGTMYTLTPAPPPSVYKVELMLSGSTLQSNVFLQQDGSIESRKLPEFARVKSFARTSAFARLCAQPCAEAFYTQMVSVESSVSTTCAAWKSVAYDAFAAILKVLQNPSQHCADVRKLRDELCAAHANSKVTTNFMREAILKAAHQPSACVVCLEAAAIIEAEQERLNAVLLPVFARVKAACSAFFCEFVAGGSFSDVYPLLSFAPAGRDASTMQAYDRCMEKIAKNQRPTVPLPTADCAMETEGNILRWCGHSSRAVRLRDVAGPGFTNTVAGHWNDACVTAHVCENIGESVLARLVVISPETDMDAVLEVAKDVQELARLAEALEVDFKARVRTCCTRVAVDSRELDVLGFERLDAAIQKLVLQAQRLPQTVLKMLKGVRAASCCFDATLSRLLQAEMTVRVRACSEESLVASRRVRTLCPLGRNEYLTYSNDGKTRITRADTQHAHFGVTCEGRIVCVHPACVQNRLQNKHEVPKTATAEDVARAVSAGELSDPVQEFLQTEGRCRVCLGSDHFAVTDDGSSIVCSRCKATVHTPTTLIERHDAASGCVNPAAGISTALEIGTVTCLGCGLVLSDYVCVDSEADERVFLDDGAPDPTHHSAAASAFLTNGSNVTFLAKPRDATPEEVRGFAKYACTHHKMNTYVYTDNAMRLTTWVKRDGHVRALQTLLHDVSPTELLKLSKTSQDVIVSRFRAIRWSNEKMCGTRLLVFALVACEVVAARDRFATFKPVKTSMCCACGKVLLFGEVRTHLLHCGVRLKQKKQDVSHSASLKRRRRLQQELLTLSL